MDVLTLAYTTSKEFFKSDIYNYTFPFGGVMDNPHGEIPGHGPLWACAEYATADHQYLSCPSCRANYEAWLAEIRRQYVNQ